jgi:hypothetical protein
MPPLNTHCATLDGAATVRISNMSADMCKRKQPFPPRLQQEGRIERFDVAVLNPTGGDLGGFIMLRGTAEQIDSTRRSEEFQRLQNRVQLIADGLRVIDAFVDEGLAQVMDSSLKGRACGASLAVSSLPLGLLLPP